MPRHIARILPFVVIGYMLSFSPIHRALASTQCGTTTPCARCCMGMTLRREPQRGRPVRREGRLGQQA